MKFNHIGIPTKSRFEGEIDLPHLKITVSDHENNPYGLQWMRYHDDAPYPELVQTVAHVAFEVNDLDAALEGQKVLIEPNSPSHGLTVAFVEVNGAPVELMEFGATSELAASAAAFRDPERPPATCEVVLHEPPLSHELLDTLTPLSATIFEDDEEEQRRYLSWRLTHMPRVTVFTALEDGETVAFKAGYALSETRYYSWLGGVHPAQRRRGIGLALMKAQHEWTRRAGFREIETITAHSNQGMLALNGAHGFGAVGRRTSRYGPQIILRKQL